MNELRHYSISDGRRAVEFNYSRPSSITGRLDYQKLDRKAETLEILRKNGVPVPAGVVFEPKETSLEELKAHSESIGYPLVLKPDVGSFGDGVLTGLIDWNELQASYEYLIREFNPTRVILEKHHTGKDHRLLVVGDRVIGAARRVPAHVIGDGASSIIELIEAKNSKRSENPFLSGGLIKVDYEVEKCLADQQLELHDVPEAGKYVTLRRVANASAGGDIVDVTNEIPDEIKAAAVDAVKAFPRILIAGVDILFNPSDEANPYTVIEINARPHIGVNMYPSIGSGRDVPNAIIDTLFPGTHRPKVARIKTLRFDRAAVLEVMRSGITTQVVLPSIPKHLYPYRRHFTFTAPNTGSGPKSLPRHHLLKLARQHGVVGSVSRGPGRVVVMTVAGESAEHIKPVVGRLQEWSGSDPLRAKDWRGPITTTFSVD